MENAGHKEAAKMPKVNEDGQNMWYKHAQSNVSIKRRNGNGEQDMTRGHVQWLQCTIPFSPQTESCTKQLCRGVTPSYTLDISRLALYHNTRSHCASWSTVSYLAVQWQDTLKSKCCQVFRKAQNVWDEHMSTWSDAKDLWVHQGVTSFALFGRGRLSWQLLVRLTDQYLAGLATDFLRLPNIFTDAPWLECLSSCQQCK